MLFQWAVIGAGPAGIAVVGKLLDAGVPADKIAWLDPLFTVGDFGTLWRNVPSNTRVKLFLKFLTSCQSFDYAKCPLSLAINSIDPEQTCRLSLMADALQWVTEQLQKKVCVYRTKAECLNLQNRSWNVSILNEELVAKNVVLAVGAEPKNLFFSAKSIIPLQDAMDSQRIKTHLHPHETIGVFGSSHSAMLVLQNLVESGAKRVINFYRSPLRYAVQMADWILFDDTGLKGPTAGWAKRYIDGELPANLERIYSNEENIEHHLPHCDKVIYAVGFERRTLPVVKNVSHIEYLEQCGIISPGLFGFGIAFPEGKYNPFNIYEYRVGLWKFMDYLERVLPVWLKYSP